MNYMKMNAGFSHKSTDLKIRGLLIDKNIVLDDKEREWDGWVDMADIRCLLSNDG